MGFVNSEVNKIECSQCKISTKLKDHLNFSSDEDAARKWFEKIRAAHTVDCLFKPGAGKLPQKEFGVKRFEPSSFVIMSRKLFYLRWQEIMVSLVKTYSAMESFP